jgi:hypothetical protein
VDVKGWRAHRKHRGEKLCGIASSACVAAILQPAAAAALDPAAAAAGRLCGGARFAASAGAGTCLCVARQGNTGAHIRSCAAERASSSGALVAETPRVQTH